MLVKKKALWHREKKILLFFFSLLCMNVFVLKLMVKPETEVKVPKTNHSF